MKALYVLIGLFVGLFIGFVRSYLTRKGENLATHEDINKLVDQVKAVTQATKEIEHKLSNEVWDRQKQWELKRDAVTDATKKLTVMMSKITQFYAIVKTDHQYGEKRIEKRVEVYREFNEAANTFDQAVSLVALVCGDELSKELYGFSSLVRTIAGDLNNVGAAGFENKSSEITKAEMAIREAMRRELGIGQTKV